MARGLGQKRQGPQQAPQTLRAVSTARQVLECVRGSGAFIGNSRIIGETKSGAISRTHSMTLQAAAIYKLFEVRAALCRVWPRGKNVQISEAEGLRPSA